MTLFMTLAIGLTAIALWCVLHPLLRGAGEDTPVTQTNLDLLRAQSRELRAQRDAGALSPAAYEQALAELQRRVADETGPAPAAASQPPQRVAAGVLAVLVPLVAAGMYYHAGSPAALAVTGGSVPDRGPRHEVSAADVSTLIQGLSERMQREPGNADGWYMLARSYTAIGRYHDAVQAYQRLAVLVPDDPAVLADYADVLATTQNGALAGRPEELVKQALALDPRNVKALALAGSAAFERQDYGAAKATWQRMLPLLPADDPTRAGTESNIAEADRRLAGGAADAPVAPSPDGASIAGTVALAPQLAAGIAPTDTVFIFARAAEGGGPPLAVRRITAAQLPYRFVLDDSTSMSPALRLSAAGAVVVTARVSRHGSATPAAGDLEGRSGTVRPGVQDIAVTIDTRRP